MPRLRDLPWRRVRDPWAILVAEVMLQQTQAQRVIPKWEAFLASFPTPAACADASLGDVLRLWHGLGYPRRARNLHLAAREIVDRHGGVVPDYARRPARPPGDRPVHRPRRARVRLRTGRGGRRHQHRPRARPHVRGEADAEGRPGRRRCARAARRGLGVEPDPDGPRCHHVPPDAGLRGVSGRVGRAGGDGRAGRRPTRRSDRRGSAARSRASRAATARPAAGCWPRSSADSAPAASFDERILASLVADGLVALDAGIASLP